MLYLVSFPDTSLWILSKLYPSLRKASICSGILLPTDQYFSSPIFGFVTVCWNRCTFSASNNPVNFSPAGLEFLLNSSFLTNFSITFSLSSFVWPGLAYHFSLVSFIKKLGSLSFQQFALPALLLTGPHLHYSQVLLILWYLIHC
jgi:hypothetical protein